MKDYQIVISVFRAHSARLTDMIYDYAMCSNERGNMFSGCSFYLDTLSVVDFIVSRVSGKQ